MITRGHIFVVTAISAILGFWVLAGNAAWAAQVVTVAGIIYLIIDFFTNCDQRAGP